MKLVSMVLFITFLFACKSKEEANGPSAPSINNDFTEQFKVLELRLSIGDTSLDKNIAAEKPLKIVGSKYFPDSLIYKYFDKGSKINYYAIGKVQNEDQEIYVVLKAISGTRKAAYVLVYNNQLQYKDGTMICQTDGDNKTSYYASMDKSFNITIRRTDFMQGQEPLLTEIFLGYNNTGKLGSLVTNDTDGEVGLQNPLDTLPQTKKFTGDYYLENNKVNMISLRDSKDTGELLLFFNYDKSVDCRGFIKDKLKMTGTNSGAYMKDGDPCIINFMFSNNSIKVIEESGCGNKKNSFDCTLNGTFTKATKKNTPKGKDAKSVNVSPLGAKPAAAIPTTTNPTLPVNPKVNPKKPVTKPAVPKPAKPIDAAPKKPIIKQPDIQ